MRCVALFQHEARLDAQHVQQGAPVAVQLPLRLGLGEVDVVEPAVDSEAALASERLHDLEPRPTARREVGPPVSRGVEDVGVDTDRAKVEIGGEVEGPEPEETRPLAARITDPRPGPEPV